MPRKAETYDHPESKTPMRPEAGAQARFKKKKPPATYRYDSSLDPELQWDGQNPAREEGEALLKQILEADSLEEAKGAAAKLRAMSAPFLNWAGKAERLSFDVPTLPLFIHERLSTKAILETLAGHRRDTQLDFMAELFGDPGHSITDQVLRAYEYQDDWVNRMVLGDSLVVMNSLLHYENLGGQVQMIYMDPPYGVKFGSNFQPFVRKRDVKHNDDDDLTREPEMVKAYRDTWEMGLHSYLTYLRDRLLLCRELLADTGSIFVQISDENLHHVREVMDEVFGKSNFVVTIVVRKKGNQKGELIDPINDYILWFAKDEALARSYYSQLFTPITLDSDLTRLFNYVELQDGRAFTVAELSRKSPDGVDYAATPARLFADFPGARLFASTDLAVGGVRKNQSLKFEFEGRLYDPGIARGNCWKHTARAEDGSPSGMQRLADAGRLLVQRGQIRYRRYHGDFGYTALSNLWDDVGGASNRIYAVQTSLEVVKRCILMTTRPGDLVLDPTCGSGTTAYVAEQWGRRWITVDVSRVPLALARQRLLTATLPYYLLADEARGPAGGFIYKRKQNKKGEEVGGIVPHITSSSIANGAPPAEEVLVDRPEVVDEITRVTGPFAFEATIPTPVDWDADGVEDTGAGEEYGAHVKRMLEILRRSPVLHVGGGKTVTLDKIREPAKALSLSAEALAGKEPVAILFGPGSGAVSEKLVSQAAKEANLRNYKHLYAIGFAIEPAARKFVEECEAVADVPATYVQATPDVMMGDLLKNMRSSQIFSVCGLPEIKVHPQKGGTFTVELLGLDVFDPVTMDAEHQQGAGVPAWFLDTDYNKEACFHVCQAFFPRTGAWDNLKRSLKGAYEDSVWEHLAGTESAPFEAGDHRCVAVKVIDDRGNELLVVEPL